MHTTLKTFLLVILGFTSLVAMADNPLVGVSGTFVFDTKPPVVTLLGPNGGQSYAATQFIPVSWTAADEQMGINPVSIGMSSVQNGTYQPLLQNISNSGSQSVQPLCVSTQYGRFQVNVRDAFGNVGHIETNNYFTVTAANFISLTADFTVSTYQPPVGDEVQFTDASSGTPAPNQYLWTFGNEMSITVRNPIYHFTKPGPVEVTLKVSNGTGIDKTITKSIQVVSNNNGIDIEIVETAGGTPAITHVGFKDSDEDYFDVNSVGGKRLAHITFGTSSGSNHGMENNTIYLYNESKVQLGHITFEYENKWQKEFLRNVILFFHNDGQIQSGNFFPYSTNSPDYEKGWKYYKIGEYPVSMLIPPNNQFIAQPTTKTPLLFIHGWEGKCDYSTDPDAKKTANELSYWFTTVYYVNGNNNINSQQTNFDGWQFYYPYNTDIPHIAMCLNAVTDSLKTRYYPSRKIGLITHSMGSLSTIEMITNLDAANKSRMQSRFSKVLFIVPPIHGSSGANYYYKTILGYMVELSTVLDYDHYAPCVRDMSLASNFIWEIQNERENNWIALNSSDNNNRYLDFFVLMGTTPKWYKSDKSNRGLGIVWNEATNHHDGIVAMSSASLLDKGIGFATYYGNHSDGASGQTKVRDEPAKQNIGKVEFIPNIITSYFSNDYQTFLSNLDSNQDIKAVVKADGSIVKPPVGGITIENLNKPGYSTGEQNVNYQTGTMNFELEKPTGNDIYTACYNSAKKDLILYPYDYPLVIAPFGYTKIGCFNKNQSVKNKNRYFFNQRNLKTLPIYPYFVWVPYGTAMSLLAGDNNIRIFRNYLSCDDNYATPFSFKYCQTNYLVFHASGSWGPVSTLNNQTDSKSSTPISSSPLPSDTMLTSFYVDDQATLAEFEMSSLDAQTFSIPIALKLQMPDGTVIDSNYVGGEYSKNLISGNYKMRIANPMVGKWKVWAESNHPGADTIQYSATAYLISDIYAYLISDTAKVNVGANFQIVAGLQMDTLTLSDSLVVKATVTKPNGDTLMYDMSAGKTPMVTAWKFTRPFVADTMGYYSIKLNFDGVYNGHHFERVLFHQLEAIDTTVYLKLPDISLTELSNSSTIDLRNYAFNYDCPYDSITFTETVLSSNLDSTVLSHFLNDTTLTANFISNLSDTGTVVIKYSMHLPDNNVVRDTIRVHVLLPDLKIMNHAINNSTVFTDSTMIASCQVKNQGNTYAGSFQVKYFLSADSVYGSSDVPIGARTINNLESDSSVIISDTLNIPPVTNAGNFHLIFVTDPDNSIKELNDSTNNLATVPLQVNRLSVLTLRLYLEGLFNSVNGSMHKAHDAAGTKFPGAVADLISISLASASPPYAVLQTFNNVPLDTNGIASITVPQNLTGTCYIVVNHRNSLETWSIAPIAIDSAALRFDFTLSAYAAFGNNLKNFGTKYIIHGGDVNQDGSTDALDMILTENAKANGVTGYTVTDLNGDGMVNDADMILLQNNASSFIMRKRP